MNILGIDLTARRSRHGGRPRDVAAIEAIQELHDRLGPNPRPEIRRRTDAGSLCAPRVIADMIERELSHVTAEQPCARRRKS